jgi:hypothetical protein
VRLISFCLTVLLSVGPPSGSGLVHAQRISPECHPWGRFKPGAWRLARVVKEEIDRKGLVTPTSIIDTRTTLLDVEEDGVTLEADVVHEVAGKRFRRQPETLKEGFHGELLSPDLKIKETGNAEVVIEGRKISCKVLQLEFSGPASKTVTDVYYSPAVAPYVLKRQSVTSDLKGDNSRSETTIEVVALDMPCKVLAEIQNTAFVKTVTKHSKGSTTTWAATSTAVPGGVVWHSSKELDNAGRVIRRSTLELVDYGLELEPQRTGLFGRRRRGIFRLPLRPSP